MRLNYFTLGLLVLLAPVWLPIAVVGWIAYQLLSMVYETLDVLSEWWWTR